MIKKILDKPFETWLLNWTAAVTSAIGFQVNWAINHGYDKLGTRFLTAFVGFFIIYSLITNLVNKFLLKKSSLALPFFFVISSSAFPFLILYKAPLKILLIGTVIWLAIVTLRLMLKDSLVSLKTIYNDTIYLFKFLTRPSVVVDVQFLTDNQLQVSFYGKNFKNTTDQDIKELMVETLYDMPNNKSIDSIVIDAKKLFEIDDRFDYVVKCIEQYAQMIKVKDVSVIRN